MVRMSLEPVEGIERMAFDLGARTVDVIHEGPREPILEALSALELGAAEVEREDRVSSAAPDASPAAERRVLLAALGINASLFLGELAAGIACRSMGLVADSLDMLADALVYSLSLAAVGRSASRKRRLAAVSALGLVPSHDEGFRERAEGRFHHPLIAGCGLKKINERSDDPIDRFTHKRLHSFRESLKLLP